MLRTLKFGLATSSHATSYFLDPKAFARSGRIVKKAICASCMNYDLEQLQSATSCKCFMMNCRRNINFRQTFLPFFVRGLDFNSLILMHSFNSSDSHYISPHRLSTLSSLEAINFRNCTTLSNQKLLFSFFSASSYSTASASTSTAALAAFVETSAQSTFNFS